MQAPTPRQPPNMGAPPQRSAFKEAPKFAHKVAQKEAAKKRIEAHGAAPPLQGNPQQNASETLNVDHLTSAALCALGLAVLCSPGAHHLGCTLGLSWHCVSGCACLCDMLQARGVVELGMVSLA